MVYDFVLYALSKNVTLKLGPATGSMYKNVITATSELGCSYAGAVGFTSAAIL